MKLTKANLIPIALTASFLLFAAGFCIGSLRTTGDLRAITARQAEPSVVTERLQAAQPDTPVDLNTATVEELTALPGIGDVIARRIVAYRQAHGPFTSLEELAEVEGIGQKRIEGIQDYVTLGGTT